MEINQWLYKSMYKLLHSYAVNYLAKKKIYQSLYVCKGGLLVTHQIVPAFN